MDLKPIIREILSEINPNARDKSGKLKNVETIEAYGVKGMKSTPWRKVFKDYDALSDWADANDAEVYGTRTLINGQPIDPE